MNSKIVTDKVFNTVYVTRSLILPSHLEGPEGSLAYDSERHILMLKTKNGWKQLFQSPTPSAPSIDYSNELKINLHKDCLEISLLGDIDEDLLLRKIQDLLDEYKGKIRKVQIKEAKDKLSKDFQKLLERIVKRSKINNNGLAELDL